MLQRGMGGVGCSMYGVQAWGWLLMLVEEGLHWGKVNSVWRV